jgi:hypothetical protein
LGVGLAVYEVLSYYVIGSIREVLVRNRLDFEREVEIAKIFEGNWRHSDLILLCWYFYNGSILVRFIKIFDAQDLRNFTFSVDRKANRYQTLKLNFQKSFNDIVLPHWRYLDCNFYLSSLFLSDFKPHFFKILKPFVASN